jgi:hypothetical protein
MLSRRNIFLTLDAVRVARYLTPDSSPQGNYDFLNTIEELMIRPLAFAVVEPFDAFGGFSWERRSLVVTTIARGESSTVVKREQIAHSLALESGIGNLTTCRKQVKGYLSDQGVEFGVRRSTFGSASSNKAVLDGVKSGAIDAAAHIVTSLVFLMNALQQIGILHVLFNALETAFTELPEWKDFETRLKAICKLLGDQSYKERLLAKCFNGAERSERKLIHRFEGEHVDWRWEHLESLMAQIVYILDVLRKYFSPEFFKEDQTMITLVVSALACPFFECFGELVFLVCASVGRESSWFEGCYCHEDILTSHSTDKVRRRAMVEAGAFDKRSA